MLPIQLIKNADKSVSGMLPCGDQLTWPAYLGNKPTKRNKKVMLNCYYWAPIWVNEFSTVEVN